MLSQLPWSDVRCSGTPKRRLTSSTMGAIAGIVNVEVFGKRWCSHLEVQAPMYQARNLLLRAKSTVVRT